MTTTLSADSQKSYFIIAMPQNFWRFSQLKKHVVKKAIIRFIYQTVINLLSPGDSETWLNSVNSESLKNPWNQKTLKLTIYKAKLSQRIKGIQGSQGLQRIRRIQRFIAFSQQCLNPTNSESLRNPRKSVLLKESKKSLDSSDSLKSLTSMNFFDSLT